MPDAKTEAVTTSLDDLNQLASALAMFRKGCANIPPAASAMYLHRAAGLMEMVVHDLNSVAGQLAEAFELEAEAVATGWQPMEEPGHGLGHDHSHGQGCGCGCDNH